MPPSYVLEAIGISEIPPDQISPLVIVRVLLVKVASTKALPDPVIDTEFTGIFPEVI